MDKMPVMADTSASKTRPADSPIVVRLRFARSEPAIWLAHLDLMRPFERSIRRAGLPVAYSKGFNPRPHLAFALPIGTGLATRDDYVDVYLEEMVEAADLMARLNRSLPSGLSILAARPISGTGPSLMSLICAADYRLEGKGLASAAGKLLQMPADQSWPVEKSGKNGKSTLDVRPLLLSIRIMRPEDSSSGQMAAETGNDTLVIRVKAGSKENLRPDLFVAALTSLGGLDPLAGADTAITRERLLITPQELPGVLQSPIPLPDED